MKLTIITKDDRILNVDVGPDELVENVKAILEVETSISVAKQCLFHNGKELNNFVSLRAAQVADGDLLQFDLKQDIRPSNPQPTAAAAPPTALRPDGTAVNPLAFQRHLRANRSALHVLNQSHPALLQRLLDGNVDQFQSALLELLQLQAAAARAPPPDPMDPNYQRRLEEEIRQANIAENLEMAYEYNPAQLVQVQMLYVPMEVNGNPLNAFIDSGAQMTIMSDECAERVGIMRLCDRRYAGVAVGVGQGKIVGRIHNVQLKIGPNFYMCGITVLESSSIEFLFGLDMLRRHRCAIDLEHNVLRVSSGEVAVPFLTGSDAPPADEFGRAAGGAATEETASEAQGPTGAAVPDSQRQSGTGSAAQPESEAVENEKVERLIALGFPRVAVIEALAACQGNEEYAAGVLFGG